MVRQQQGGIILANPLIRFARAKLIQLKSLQGQLPVIIPGAQLHKGGIEADDANLAAVTGGDGRKIARQNTEFARRQNA